MFKIDSPGATGENRFKETPLPATQVSSEWLNAVQDELVNAVAAGAAVALPPAPNKEDSGQLGAVLLQIVARFAPMKAALDEIVTNEEIGGNDGLDYDSPEQVLVVIRQIIASAMAVTDHGDGQRTISFGFGAWRLKMGRYSEALTGEVVRAVSFAEEFESACWHVFCQDAIAAANNNQDLRTQVIRPTITTAGFSVQLQSDHDDDMGLAGFDWFAIGH
jgi:hypothetical protein